MKYAVEMGSGAMTYIPNFIKIGSGIQNLMRGDSQTHKHTQTAWKAQAYFNFLKISKLIKREPFLTWTRN
jgi:hypothetical protein